MAYRLRPDESVSHGLRRLARKELAAVRNELRRTTPPHDEAVHEGRKHLKKVRAILQLVEADGGKSVGWEKGLRKVNRTLSELRDADAMIGVLAKLKSRNPRLFSEHTFARVRRRLLSHKRAAMEAADRDGAWTKIARELRKARRAAKRLRPRHRGFAALAQGIQLTHRRGRKAVARAQKRQRASDFHGWRKQMKALWYELRLVEGCARGIQRDVGALHTAETCLGDDHNLVVLCEELSKDASVCGADELDRLRLAADKYQCALRRKAIATTVRIYSRKSAGFLRVVKRAWKAWRGHDKSSRMHATRHRAA